MQITLSTTSIAPDEVIMAPTATIDNLAAVAGFLRWLADLYDADNFDLIACDAGLGENFGKIRDVYAAVLAAVQVAGGA
jgi:hypothetical protein